RRGPRRTRRRRRTGRREVAVALLARTLLEVDEAVSGQLEGRPLLAVAALELAGLEATLDEDLVAFAQILGGALGAIAPDADTEPVGRLDPLVGLLILRALVDRDVELGDRSTARRVAHLGIRAEVADDHHLAQGHRGAPSVDGGRSRFGLGLVDPFGDILVVLVLGRREIGVVRLLAVLLRAVAATRAGRSFIAGHEMAEDLFGDLERALHLGEGRGRRLEENDVVRALAVAVDLVGQPAAAARGDLDDLAAVGDQLAGGAVDDRLGLVVRDVGTQDQHQFVSAHAPVHSFQWESSRWRQGRRGTERKRCQRIAR